MLYDIDIYKQMLDTLASLGKDGPDSFYRGDLGKALVQDLDGVISEEDLADYRPVEREAIQIRIGKYQVRLTVPIVWSRGVHAGSILRSSPPRLPRQDPSYSPS